MEKKMKKNLFKFVTMALITVNLNLISLSNAAELKNALTSLGEKLTGILETEYSNSDEFNRSKSVIFNQT